MAYDPGLAEIMHDDLAQMPDISEKKMFGGLAFMLNGHMLCGVTGVGAMYRVGKENEQKALDLPGVVKMTFTGRPMGGFVEVSEDALADDQIREQLLTLAQEFIATLPAK